MRTPRDRHGAGPQGGGHAGAQPPLKVWNQALKKQKTCTRLVWGKKPWNGTFRHRQEGRQARRWRTGGEKDKEGHALTLGYCWAQRKELQVTGW